MISLRRLRVAMTALVGEEAKATLSMVARVCRGHTVAALAKADYGQGEQAGGLIKALGVAHQAGMECVVGPDAVGLSETFRLCETLPGMPYLTSANI